MTLSLAEKQERARRLADAIHIQKIENNPLTSDEIAMFEMFEREGWSHEKRRAYIMGLAKSGDGTVAAE